MSLQTILVVDDSPEVLDAMKSILKRHYALRMATNGRLALQIALSDSQIDLILLDVMMPEMDGFEVCRQLKSNEHTCHIPVIFVTERNVVEDESRGFSLGAADYISKPASAPRVLARVATHITLANHRRHLEDLVRQRTLLLESKTRELEATRMEILHRLGRAGDYRDNETGMHVLRISHYVSLLGKKIGLVASEIESLGQAALMHDIGKIGVPDQILLKPGELTADEFAVVKRHCEIGADIIGMHESPLLQMCRTVALTHHERWDGAGYPCGLAGVNIPLAGRMTAVADVFDALTSNRPFRACWSVDAAIDKIRAEAGHGLDPSLANAFLELRPELDGIMATFPDGLGERAHHG